MSHQGEHAMHQGHMTHQGEHAMHQGHMSHQGEHAMHQRSNTDISGVRAQSCITRMIAVYINNNNLHGSTHIHMHMTNQRGT